MLSCAAWGKTSILWTDLAKKYFSINLSVAIFFNSFSFPPDQSRKAPSPRCCFFDKNTLTKKLLLHEQHQEKLSSSKYTRHQFNEALSNL